MGDNYIVSARKYRPATFRSVVGQKNLTSTLKNAIEQGRLAQAYLFCGPRGVGKTSCARIFAKTINCTNRTADGEACGECESCRAIGQGNSFNIVELDAASNNSVDDIRSINEQVNIPPQQGQYRVFIIDEVHMLSSAAFNAFLKTLEEPPSYAVFILATTEKHKVIPTILSRCQIYDFKRITIDDIVEHLQYVAGEEGMVADPKALGVIARKADGAMRDALSIFDQVAASTRGQLSYEAVVDNLNVLDYDYFFKLVESFARADVPQALLLYKEVRDRGFDSLFFVNSLAQHVRDLMVAADARTRSLLEVPADIAERLTAQSASLPVKWYYAAMKLLNDCDFNYRTASNKQFLVELTLIRLCQLLDANGGGERPAGPAPMRGVSAPAPAQLQAQPTAQAQPTTQAQPTAQAQPQMQPQVQAPRPATGVGPNREAPAENEQPSRRTAPMMKRVRLSDPVAEVADTTRRREEPFDDKAFGEAWERFAVMHPEMHLLVSAMRQSAPIRLSATEMCIRVEHPAQVQAFESSMAKVLEFLRDALKNDLLTLKVEINPESTAVKRLAPQELLKKIMTDNPVLGEFLQSIDAEIV